MTVPSEFDEHGRVYGLFKRMFERSFQFYTESQQPPVNHVFSVFLITFRHGEIRRHLCLPRPASACLALPRPASASQSLSFIPFEEACGVSFPNHLLRDTRRPPDPDGAKGRCPDPCSEGNKKASGGVFQLLSTQPHHQVIL